jgi:hypothetical protein
MTLHSTFETLKAVRAVLISGCFGGNLAALALIRRPSRVIESLQYNLFGWRMIAEKGLPMRQVHSLFPDLSRGPAHIEMLPDSYFIKQRDANYAKDMLYLALLARALPAKVVFEIGTLDGCTASLFALNTPVGATVFTLDLPRDTVPAPTLRTTIVDDAHILKHQRQPDYLYQTHAEGEKKVKQLYGDSAAFDFSPYRQRVDLFFIDGAHSYEYVRSDTEKALACVRPGGLILWHDYGRWRVNGVSKWLHELARTGRDVCRLPGSSLALLRV